MHSLDAYLQGEGFSKGEKALDGLENIATSRAYSHVDVSVAYASTAGTEEFVERILGALVDSEDVTKRWLISIDFGQTSPESLEALLELPRSDVRVPNGLEVLERRLVPRRCFHPKTYVFRQDHFPPKARPAAALMGSANMTMSGLYTNVEHCLSAGVWGRRVPSDRQVERIFAELGAWWRVAWKNADRIDEAFISRYRKLRRRRTNILQDADEMASAVTAGEKLETSRGTSAGWAAANSFWIQTGVLYKNRGAGKPGNQLDCTRGTRVFFGFPPKSVEKNTVFGEVEIQYLAFPPQVRTVRFGDNSMDKVNLPIPDGISGPTSYDNSYLLFEKVRPHKFRLSKMSANQVVRARRRSTALGMYATFGHGREYGFY